MAPALISELVAALAPQGFREVADPASVMPGVEVLLKRQTWNTNRAVVVVRLAEPPLDFGGYLRRLRKQVAFRCRFFPFFWGIGIQVVAVAPGFGDANIDPASHVARVDNQWAIIQSVFLVDSAAGSYRSGRSWGQVVTGKFQDQIANVLSRHFRPQDGP